MESVPDIQPGSFQTTRWTRVCLAKSESDDGRGALAELCEAYYEPVVAFLRCELRDADAGREMTTSTSSWSWWMARTSWT